MQRQEEQGSAKKSSRRDGEGRGNAGGASAGDPSKKRRGGEEGSTPTRPPRDRGGTAAIMGVRQSEQPAKTNTEKRDDEASKIRKNANDLTKILFEHNVIREPNGTDVYVGMFLFKLVGDGIYLCCSPTDESTWRWMPMQVFKMGMTHYKNTGTFFVTEGLLEQCSEQQRQKISAAAVARSKFTGAPLQHTVLTAKQMAAPAGPPRPSQQPKVAPSSTKKSALNPVVKPTRAPIAVKKGDDEEFEDEEDEEERIENEGARQMWGEEELGGADPIEAEGMQVWSEGFGAETLQSLKNEAKPPVERKDMKGWWISANRTKQFELQQKNAALLESARERIEHNESSGGAASSSSGKKKG